MSPAVKGSRKNPSKSRKGTAALRVRKAKKSASKTSVAAKPAVRPKEAQPRAVAAAHKAKVQPPKPRAKTPEGKEIGKVVGYFRLPGAAIVKISKGGLSVGDRVWIAGHTTDLRQTVASMQIDHQPIQVAKKGQEIGLQVEAKVRRNDRLFKIS